MKHLLRYVLGLFCFWMLVFALQRGFFLVYNAGELKEISTPEIWLSFVYALKMDAATAAFMITLPLLLMITGIFIPKRIFSRLANVITVILLLIVLLVGLADTGLYSNWGSKINSKALYYLMFPGEGARSVDAVPVWLFILVFLLEAGLCVFCYLRWLRAKPVTAQKPLPAAAFSLLLLGLLPILFRGGFQKYPVGKNDVYYSRHCVLNYAAMNSPWNLINAWSHLQRTDNPYHCFNAPEVRQLLDESLRMPCDSTRQILKVPRPNIVLILMESVSAENMQTLGGKEAIMPGLDSLTAKGLLFSRFYASGFRTEQGLIATLSSFPAQPTVTIQREFGKFERLSSLPRTMSDAGYTCNYYYSGDLNFANTSAYLHASGFTKLLDRDARDWQKTTEWGALDEELFACHLREAGGDPQPFFSILMTSTNHEPFDAPVTQTFAGSGEEIRYRNTVRYTDSCVSAYIRQAERQSWYANTLFIVTSDHAHFYPVNRSKSEPERHHIPLLLLGGALQDSLRGQVIPQVTSQVDISALLLNQLGIRDTTFRWSRNPLNPCGHGLAFYSFDNGFGWITDQGQVVYDYDLKQVLVSSGPAPEVQQMLNHGKAYLQEVFEEYLGK